MATATETTKLTLSFCLVWPQNAMCVSEYWCKSHNSMRTREWAWLLCNSHAHTSPCYALASYPGLLTPAFVTCSTNTGEGLVKLITCNNVPGHVKEWHIPSVKQLSEPKKRCQDCLMLSTQSFYGSCLWLVAHSLTCGFSRNVPLLHMSRYVNARHSVLPGLPPH